MALCADALGCRVLPTELAKCDGAASFLQSGFWGSFKARFDWNARPFLVQWTTGTASPLLVIRRKLTAGISFAYVPWGPEVSDDLSRVFLKDPTFATQTLVRLAESLKELLPHDTAFIRFDPPWYSKEDVEPVPELTRPFVRASIDVQPPDSVIIDISRSEEEILAGMKPKWRYNIRLAEKRGVTVTRLDAEGIDIFYSLYQETARRDRIAIHEYAYYRTLFQHAKEYHEPSIDLRLYVAFYEGSPLAAIIVLFRKKEATYLYGASANQKRNLMAPYALQWKAICDAKVAGCVRYDLFGIPPREDPDHPMVGLYRFKTGFGGTIIHRPGSWDYSYKPVVTGMFRGAELLRKKIRLLRKALLKKNREL